MRTAFLLRYTIGFTLSIILFGCHLRTERQASSYTGFFLETKWTLLFQSDNVYKMSYEGHAGVSTIEGKYLIYEETIFLIPETEFFDDPEMRRLRRVDKGCLQDYNGNIYCQSEKILIVESEVLWNKRQLAHNAINDLQEVKEKLKSSNDIALQFDGIKVIDGINYWEYQLSSWLPEYRRNAIHLRFYVRHDPIRIYDQKLVLIEEI